MQSHGPSPLTLAHWMVATSRHRRDAPAISDDVQSLSYGDLLVRVEEAARALLAAGLERARPVCLVMAPSTEYMVQLYGCLLAGGVPAPVNTKLAPREVVEYLARLSPALVVHDAESAHLLAGTGDGGGATYPCHDPAQVTVDSHRSEQDRTASIEALLGALREDDPAIIFPTGGTTGLPKGSYTDHRGLQLWVWNVATSTRRHQHEVELYWSPFFHVSLVVGGLAPLFAGGHMVIQPTYDATRSIEMIREYAVTRLMGAPTLFLGLTAHPDAAGGVLHGIRDIIFGSTAASEAFVNGLLTDFPNAQIQTGYGATELASGVTRATDHDLRRGRVSGVGRPSAGCEIRIVGFDGAEVAPGETGEVIVRSPWQTRGYWNQPDETAGTYRADGFINLGDLGRFDEDGWLHIVGRTKEMIKTGGENVFPVEVESVLASLPGVAEATVFGVTDDYWGERVEAAVTAKPGVALDLDRLRVELKSGLAGYKVPKRIHLVDSIPLTPNNKPDRRALAAAFKDGV